MYYKLRVFLLQDYFGVFTVSPGCSPLMIKKTALYYLICNVVHVQVSDKTQPGPRFALYYRINLALACNTSHYQTDDIFCLTFNLTQIEAVFLKAKMDPHITSRLIASVWGASSQSLASLHSWNENKK